MILDKELQFSDSAALTASANSSVVNLGAASRLGSGEPMVVVINVEVAADVANADETYAIALQMDTAEGFGSPTSVVSRTILGSALTAGSLHTLDIPAEVDLEQFLRLAYTLGGTTPSVTVSAHLAPKSFADKFKTYPDNSVIS